MLVSIDWLSLSPVLALLSVACISVIASLFVDNSRHIAMLGFIGLGLAGMLNVNLFATGIETGAFGSSFDLRYLADLPALGFNFVILIGTSLAMLMSYDYLKRTDLEHPEYYPLMLLSACGAMVMAAAGDLITLLLGLEIMSLAVYVLAAWRQKARESEEAGMKYFLLGAFASAFLIYGIAFMYGATGSFVYADIATALQNGGSSLYALLGGMFILGGLGFKVAFAPFHQWAPDVYTGSPTTVTAYMSVVVKAAAFAALLRIFASVFTILPYELTQSLVVLIVLTLLIGNLAALLQKSFKRMLAYSAVAHAGYLGLAVLAVSSGGMRAAIWYLTAYALMTAGAFAVLTLLTDDNDHGDGLERFSGLGRTRPGLALAMTIFLFSLAGIPLFAGFVGKILVFQAVIAEGYIGLAVLGIVSSMVAVVYYIRPVTFMYFREPDGEPPRHKSVATQWAIGLAAAGTLLLGVLPGWWYGLLDVGQAVLAGF